MSRHFATFVRFFLLVFGVTAVLTLTVHASPTLQGSIGSRPRFGLEQIPHQPGEELPAESALSVTAPDVMIPWSKVTFQSLRNGNWDIFVGNDDGSGQTAVVSTSKSEIHPHLNRGNTRIVYASDSGGDYEIYTVNYDGTGKTPITNNSSDDGNPSWSPDGSKIVFESYRNGEADIYVMNANGSNQTRLTTNGDYDGMPTWSPDGSQIAFVSRRTGGYRIYVMNVDGSGQTQLSNQPYSLRPHWSPDGSKIAYDADNDNDGWQDLWYMNADGSSQSQIYNPSGQTDAWAAGWSPDAQIITYTLISFIQYQGNWYWTDAYQRGITLNGGFRHLGSNDRDWEPNWQTSDNIFPSSSIKNLASTSSGPIYLQWFSSESGGSGIQNYDVQVKVGNGNWTTWLEDTTETNASYPGVGGQSYAFRVRTIDNAYNVEAWPPGADTTTTVESLPPVSFVTAVPPYSRVDDNVAVSWDGTDPGNSGIQTYDVQYRINDGSWVSWLTDIVANTAVITSSIGGDVYDFRVRAIDNAQNQGSWSSGASNGQTIFYQWGIEGNAYDNVGAPVSNVTISSNPTLLGQADSNINGFFGGYSSAENSSYEISWSKSDYGSLPATTFSYGTDAEYRVIMPPENNVVADWGFESAGWSNGWQLEGTVPALITDSISHTGQYSALLGEQLSWTQGTVPNIPDDFGYFFDVDNTNTGHLLFFDVPSDGISYQQLLPNGTWGAVEFVAFPANHTINARPEVLFEKNGRIHILWVSSTGSPDYQRYITYIQRAPNGQWTLPEKVLHTGSIQSPLQPAVDSSGNIHLLYPKQNASTNDSELFYISRANNQWGTSTKLSLDYEVDIYETSIEVDANGKIHMIWVEKRSGSNALFHQVIDPVNGWQPITRLIPGLTDPIHNTFYQLESFMGNNDNLYLFWISGSTVYFIENKAEEGWQAPVNLRNVVDNYFHRPEYAVSSQGEIFVAYFTILDGENDMYLLKRNQGGIWEDPVELRQETEDANQTYILGQIDLDIDAGGTAHIVWSEIIDPNSIDNQTMEYQIIYVRKSSVGRAEAEEIWSGLGEANSYYLPPTIYADMTGQPTLLWLANSNAPLHYKTPQAASNSGSYAFSTEVTVPLASTNPILSFLYDLAGAVEMQGESFSVTVDDGSQVTSILETSNAADWEHFWHDMSAWAGQTVTITFAFTEVANTAVSHVAIDEVTLGTSYPDLWITNNHTNGAISERITHTITFSNQGGALAENVVVSYNIPAGLAYRSSNLAPSSVSSQEIRWEIGDLVAKDETQTIEIELEILPSAPSFDMILGLVEISSASSELELLNNSAIGTTFIGTETFLPIIMTP